MAYLNGKHLPIFIKPVALAPDIDYVFDKKSASSGRMFELGDLTRSPKIIILDEQYTPSVKTSSSKIYFRIIADVENDTIKGCYKPSNGTYAIDNITLASQTYDEDEGTWQMIINQSAAQGQMKPSTAYSATIIY